jgi:THAP domain
MVFKCCVVNCRTNYDTQPNRYPVFAFPSLLELRQQWIERIETKSSKITHSSRVCVRHFNPDDVKMTNKLRTILKPNAVPVGNEHVIESESESEDEEEEDLYETGGEADELIKEDFIEHVEEEILFTFEDFNAKVDENQQSIAEHWNIYIHPSAICFYRLTTIDEVFHDVNISYKIIVSNEMQIKLFKGEVEASNKEISWAMHNSRVQSWEHFDEILDYYRQEPEIIRKRQPVKDLLKAFELFSQVAIDEIKDEMDYVKLKFGSIVEKALQLALPEDNEEEDEEDVDTKEGIIEPKQEVTYVEALDEALVTLDETSHFDDPMDGLEEIVVDVAQTKEEEELKILNKCPNCFITCISEQSLNSHMKSCNAPIFNNNSSFYKPFAKKTSKKHFKSKENYEDNKPVRKFGVKKKTPKSHPW